MQPDNPKLTAYVLDELSATDRDAVHSELARNPELAAEAEGLRRTADQLRRAFATAEAPALSVEARRAILGAGVAPILAASRLEATAGVSRFESTAVPDKLEPAGGRTRPKEPMILRLRRTFRWAACFAVLIGATYLLGLAAWKDTHPNAQFARASLRSWTLSYAPPDQVAEFIAKGQANFRQESNRTGLILPTMQQPMGLEGIDSLLYADLAVSDLLKDSSTVAGVPADTSFDAGGLGFIVDNGGATAKQSVNPELQAELASGTKIAGARSRHGFTPNPPLASTVTDTSSAAGARYEFEGKPQLSYGYMVPFRSRDQSGDGRPKGVPVDYTLNQDDLTAAGDEVFSTLLQFTETAGEPVETSGDNAMVLWARYPDAAGHVPGDNSAWLSVRLEQHDRSDVAREVRMVPVRSLSLEEAAVIIQELKNREAIAEGIDVQVDPVANTIVVDGSPADIAAIEEVVHKTATAEFYSPITDNPFVLASAEPVSTFSIDVDTASYSNIRRHLLSGQLPPKDAVRIEEMINAFRYDYPEPTAERPFSVNAEVGECPWAPAHRLVRVGLQGYQVDPKDRPPLNLVFLIDVSGSMQAANKLPLVQESLKVLLDQLWAEDRVGIVTYAGESAIALPSTPGTRYDEILTAIDALSSGGSTNGEAGIRDAYRMATDHFIEGGVNRVMLCTDGDFNVGVSDDNELVGIITEQAKSGVFLTVLGFGTGNLKDAKLEALADKGNGHYAYIDDLIEAKRVLGDEAGATLQTIAKDVKIQVQFNPALVQSYRLIGYENRLMAAQDFADDAKDAGEIGAGHSVTALYEIVPASSKLTSTFEAAGEDEISAEDAEGAEDLMDGTLGADAASQKIAAANAQANQGDAEGGDVPPTGSEDASQAEHGDTPAVDAAADSIAPMPADALLLLRLRYKAPDAAVSQLIETPVFDDGAYMEQMPRDFLFAASVASFGMLLRESPHVGDWTFEAAEELAHSGLGDDPSGYRAEFVQLVRRAIEIRAAQTAP